MHQKLILDFSQTYYGIFYFCHSTLKEMWTWGAHFIQKPVAFEVLQDLVIP